MSSHRVASDFGIWMDTVTCLARARRTQLSIVLAGRGYFVAGGSCVTLGPGDVVESDQSEQEPEGYAGTPSEVIVLEWDSEGLFRPGRPGPARISKIGARDIGALRALVLELDQLPAGCWVATLCERLRAAGLCVAGDLRELRSSAIRQPVAQCYDVLGSALSNLDAQPSLSELAETLGLSGRQAHRRVADLMREYRLPFDGWRDFVNESRLEWALQLLSVPDISISHAARTAGYRSTIALYHALSLRGAETPASMRRQLHERWG
jgi:AraC-like DNA-binding protein